MSNFLNLDLNNFKSALVSVILMGILSVITYIISVGDVGKLDFHTLINLGIMSMLTGIVSLIKSLLTNSDGKVLGMQVK